ncbi:sugar ABC transporter ATP-binding protein [Rhodococcus olei]|uniref:Sugar ABC transporter ATP-binding protein n=1 Tax=Rhodococcus olei TaxID=2161675 RepID=A0ABP8PRW2_9NOCA
MCTESTSEIPEAGDLLVDLKRVSKRFGGLMALKSVDLSIRRGEVHALLGHNGSGKSTLVKILAGYHRPEHGAEAFVDGMPLDLGSGVAARKAGLRFIHQDLGLIPEMSVVENLLLGSERQERRWGRIQWSAERARAQAAIERLGHSFDVRKKISELRAPERTSVAIARALENWERDVSCLVLDEPTASMPSHEVDDILTLVSTVAGQGVAVLYISHRLEEIIRVADTVTVLRGGTRVLAEPVAQHTVRTLAQAVVGNHMETLSKPERDPARVDGRPPVFVVKDLTGPDVNGLSFEVRAGEVVGIAGLTGSGRDTVLGSVFGRHPRTGSVTLKGRTIRAHNISDAIAAGVAYLPGDRAEGFFSTLSASENLLITAPGRHWRGRFHRKCEHEETTGFFAKLGIVPVAPTLPGSSFSGGNQQKLMLAKWLRLQPEVLLLEEPTQGVDVAAKSLIHDQIDRLAAEGRAIVVASSESEELARVCDRVLVMRDGVAADSKNGATLTANWITHATLLDSHGSETVQ